VSSRVTVGRRRSASAYSGFSTPISYRVSPDTFSISRSVRPLRTGAVPCIRHSSVRRRLSPYMDPMGKTCFVDISETYIPIVVKFCGKDRGRRTLSFGVLRIIFRFRFRSTEISKVCTVSHGGETSKIHNSGPDGDSDMRFSPLKSARRAA
jgi:hypothetical protein